MKGGEYMRKTIFGIVAALAISFFATVAVSNSAHAQTTTTVTPNTTTNTTNDTTNTTANATTNSTSNSTDNTTVPSGAPKTGFQPK